ncbi:hypothetical protein LTR64_005153 [Lithohypha guttulata]|uniref:uncharacterized protein n=1 Tax=Lithohypha guttulata TaxID=1690604 RepID=UPI00315CFD9F
MVDQTRYDGQVVVVTGAGNGLGRQYALFFAARGAKVVVNDLGGNAFGKDKEGKGQSRVADAVVKEIRDAGGIAVANYDPVQQGDRIIKTAVDNFGTVHVLINNAGILRDVTIRNMKDADWDIIMDVHVHGSFKTARAAWPFFKKQKYGRIINTSSSSGLFGNLTSNKFGQSNYAAGKMAMVGFTKTLAKEGAKYNITCNVLAPGAASRLTQTVWTPEMMDVMRPDFVVPLVGVLSHESCRESGSIFEAAAGHFSKIRWERSKGFQARPDDSLTADVLLKNWKQVVDFTDAEHPNQPSHLIERLKKALELPPASEDSSISLQGKVALVTGGGAGLGRAYALELGKMGANVVVCDVKLADKVANEIILAGGDALALNLSVEAGEEVVKATVAHFGQVDILINNAGILGDKAFQNMTDQQWYTVMSVHLRSTYRITRAAWPFMMKQRFGRVVNITSTSGIYGNFGQANYAAAKCGIIGFTKTTAREGAKYNIKINVVAPTAGTNMTRTVWPEAEVQALKPDYVAPLVGLLCSDQAPVTGQIFEAGGGWFASTRWQRARGVDFEHAKGVPSVEAVNDAFAEICNFDDGQADNPESPEEGSKYTMGNVLKNPKMASLNHLLKQKATADKNQAHMRPENRAERQQRSKQASKL